ncbi:AMIN-like domain-containing (lipo)protein [Actinocrinis sp.]|uniref:AMIN-like domain-containing (lipo)protein n=1 Tax=Actinocrinis sp. TaxID=1920516 RepID=UPI002D39FAB8|nr:hypothetical protein [Actinocrinis sp.]HZP51227.1 hypothetical protein [Actinocrinis sp.]
MNTRRVARAGTYSAFALILVAAGACGSTPANNGSPPAAPTTTAPPQSSPTGPSPTPSPSRTAQTPTPTPRQSTPAPSPAPRVVLSRVAYNWGWPGGVNGRGSVTHRQTLPPVPTLIRIGAGDHPADPGERPFNRMTFTFTAGFPSYHFEFVDKLLADGSGTVIPIAGFDGPLRVVFHSAQAHSASGASTIVSQPPRHLGLGRMVDYAQAGDFEGYLSYGIGIGWPIPQSNPQFPIRAYEVETVTASGQHLYTVAIDIDSTAPVTR